MLLQMLTFGIIYFIGMVIASLFVCYYMYRANKNSDTIEEFPAIFAVIVSLSWIGVLLCAYRYFKFNE